MARASPTPSLPLPHYQYEHIPSHCAHKRNDMQEGCQNREAVKYVPAPVKIPLIHGRNEERLDSGEKAEAYFQLKLTFSH